MSNSQLIDNAIFYIEEIFRDNADGHDLEHSMRVYRTAAAIAEKYGECDKMVVALAAILHDVDDHKLFDTENYQNARKFLKDNGVDEAMSDRVCAVIDDVSFSKNKDRVPESIEGKIVQDADRLDAMGAVGIARTFAYGGKKGRSLDDSVQHFYDKLLLLYDRLNTKEAKEIATGRHEFMVEFLNEFKKEINNNYNI